MESPENEIPQELGRADRAMRQATRELENGRPTRPQMPKEGSRDATRAMNKIKYNNDFVQNSLNKEVEDWTKNNQQNYKNPSDLPEYQGTSAGGKLELPEEFKIQEAQKIAKELYGRYNEKKSTKDKKYIKNLLDWY